METEKIFDENYVSSEGNGQLKNPELTEINIEKLNQELEKYGMNKPRRKIIKAKIVND